MEIRYGDPLMATITGTGCLLSSVVAAGLAVSTKKPVEIVRDVLCFYAIAGEQARQETQLPGDFQQAFMNQLYSLTEREVSERISLQEETV